MDRRGWASAESLFVLSQIVEELTVVGPNGVERLDYERFRRQAFFDRRQLSALDAIPEDRRFLVARRFGLTSLVTMLLFAAGREQRNEEDD